MLRSLFPVLALGLAASTLSAQDAEVYVCNTNTVRSTAVHPTTQNPYPYAPCCPPGYTTPSVGVTPGDRVWSYTPPLRVQLGTYGPNHFTLTGMIQTIRVGAAVASLPAPNHYQMRMGIAPTDPVSGGGAYQKQHSATLPDLVSIADAPVVANTRPRFEIAVTLGTPVAFGPTDLCFYLEFRGGEQQDDPNNCQMTCNDYYGGKGPGAYAYWGFTTGAVPSRTVSLASAIDFRPRVGLLIQEPVFTATGPHAYSYITGLTASEDSRGMHACAADWSTNTVGRLMFDVRAGSLYGSNGTAVVFLNFGPTWFPASFPIGGYGFLKLNPADPAFDALTSIPLTLIAGGAYFGGTSTQIVVPPLGPSAVGQFVKTQGVVFNAGLTNLALTTASSILIE